MIETWLHTSNGSTVAHASRPAILRYQSRTQRILHVLAKALPLLLGFMEESQVITVPLIKGFLEHKVKAWSLMLVHGNIISNNISSQGQ